MSYIGSLTKNLIETFSKEIKKKDNKEKIMKHIIDPIVTELFGRYSVHLTLYILLHITVILLLVYIIYSMKKP
jgi:hypothetical protein